MVAAPSTKTQQVIVNGLAIEYADTGRGPVMLLLHGWKDSLHTFDSLIPDLSAGWRVMSLDLPGFGRSELPKSPWTLADYASFVKAFCDKLNVLPQVLVGHSLGGRVVIKAVSEGVVVPAKIVLIDSAGLSKSKSLRNRSIGLLAKTGKVITLVPPLVFWRQKLRQQLYTRAGSDFLGAGPLKETFLNVISEDLRDSAARITIPALLIWGEDDDQTPVQDARVFHELLKQSQLEIIKGAGHFVHRQEPARVTDLITRFADV